MNPIADYAVEIPFEEIGIQIDGADVGMFDGTAHVDQHGSVVGLEIDGYVTDPVNPLGRRKQVTRYLKVPFWNGPAPTNFIDILAKHLAHEITVSCEPEINDKLNDWSVSLAEKEWHPEQAA
ncbi:hypothetical protein DLM45_02430 [Hyphomicrobium methylovorum]|uniref:hypothetical protein n=1 Tax=Hyphomicrobium methylovorum TaxID=84 RepID=UPI0015E75E91|nr:hypothetical protein [Hyphomicrobium methylovorum]MBA2125083.1 hypothetical protein [Hyphomicrobium methylovorum]